MPGQEKMVIEYYKKNPSAAQSIKGALYEEKIIKLLKSKIKMSIKNISSEEAEKIIKSFNKPIQTQSKSDKDKPSKRKKTKTKK